MLSPAEQACLGALKGSLRRRFGERLEALRLFGSRARGEGHPESDLDVLVAVRGLTRGERGEILDLALDLELEHGLLLSPLVRDPAARPLAPGLRREIEREGLAL
jgi:predicted nucleotidyltransferase